MNLSNTIKDNPLFLLLLIALSGLIIRIAFIASNDYWLDEAYTWWFVNRSVDELIFWIPTFESHPPFYYLLTKFWNNSVGLFIAQYPERWFSLPAFLCGLFIADRIAIIIPPLDRVIFKRIVVCCLFSGAHLIIWFSIEARPYSWLFSSFLLACYGGALVLNSLQTADARQGKNWVVLTAGIVFTNYLHNIGAVYSFVIYFYLFVSIIFSRKFIFLKPFIISCFISFLASIPLLIAIISQLENWSSGSWIKEPNLQVFSILMKNIYFPYSYEGIAASSGSFVWEALKWLFRLTLISLFFLSLRNIIKYKDSIARFYLVLIAVVPVLVFTISYFGPNILLERTIFVCLGPFLLLLAVALSRIENHTTAAVLASFLVVSTSYGGVSYTLNKGKEPWESIYDYVVSQKGENDIVATFPNALAIPLQFYDKQQDNLVEIQGLPKSYPALEHSNFYPSGTPSVPGLVLEDRVYLESLVTKTSEKIILITQKNNALPDPNSYLDLFLIENRNVKLISTKAISRFLIIQLQVQKGEI